MNDASQDPNSAGSELESGDSEPNTNDFRRTAVYRRHQAKYCKKVVVAVHGMGDQKRNDLAQSVARLFARQAAKQVRFQATRLPLGLWDPGDLDVNKDKDDSSVKDHAIGFVSPAASLEFEEFAFAEVYWADIPRQLEKEGYRLEESKRWAVSVVERLSQRHALTNDFGDNGPQRAASVIEEITETVGLLERLFWLGGIAGKFKFNLAQILESYLADVQQVADFRGQRALFLERFLKRIQALDELCPDAEEIHIVAHSEGTVLAFLGLLTALWDESAYQPEGGQQFDPKVHAAKHRFDIAACDMSWIRKVRSFTTLGSPIDKHLILFPDMWYRFTSKKGIWRVKDPQDPTKPLQPIRWRNYYDLADPVGYDLDTTRKQLGIWGCKAFDFKKDIHDHGFRRYPLPGKAHVDYFDDDELFGHIIDDAVNGKDLPLEEQPRDRLRGQIAWYLPFVLVVILHLAAVFVFHLALVAGSGDAKPNSGSVSACQSIFDTPLAILGCAGLLLGTTVVTRLFRISRDPRAWFWGVACFVGGAVAFWMWPGAYTLEIAGRLIPNSLPGIGEQPEVIRRAFFIVYALLVGVIAWLVDYRRLRIGRPPSWGLRWMIFLGGVPLCAALVYARLNHPGQETAPLIILAGAAGFLYLWWLGALVFDLAFCWAWYISTSKSLLSRAHGPPPQLLQTTPAAESAS